MVKSLGSIALATGFIGLLVACQPQTNAEFRVRLMDGNVPTEGVLVAAEVTGAWQTTEWDTTDNRGDAIAWAHTSGSLNGPSRVVFAYADPIGLSVFIEGQDFDWRRVGNTSGREWMADFEADVSPIDAPRVRTCGTDGFITYEVNNVLPETTWMSVGTSETDGIQGLDCSVDDGAVTCPCPTVITDRAFLVSRHIGDDINGEVNSGEITVDVIVEMQLATP